MLAGVKILTARAIKGLTSAITKAKDEGPCMMIMMITYYMMIDGSIPLCSGSESSILTTTVSYYVAWLGRRSKIITGSGRDNEIPVFLVYKVLYNYNAPLHIKYCSKPCFSDVGHD